MVLARMPDRLLSMKVLVHQLIESMAQRRKDATALVHEDRTVSYGELWQQVSGAATGLARLGLGRQERGRSLPP